MYVMPSGVIELYSGVPLREDYQNTFSFRNETEQRTYFVNKRVRELTEQLYTRRTNGVIRVRANIADLQNVDYLSFLNHGTFFNDNKRFYCFVINTAYVNENVTDILFVIDVIQTYMFDITYKQSYVEQTHVNLLEDLSIKRSDFDTTYILPQNVDIGEYAFFPLTFNHGTEIQDVFGNFVYVVAATFDKNFNNAVGGLQNGFYSGLAFNVFDNVNDINNFLLSAASNNKADGIVNIFMAPNAFVSYPGMEEIDMYIPRDIWDDIYRDNIGYVPRNWILYTAPFCKIVLTDNNGTVAEYYPQFFTDLYYDERDQKYKYEFKCTCVCAGSNEFSIFPVNYKGTIRNYNEQIVLNITPQCAFATDSYRAWLAQNSAKMSVERNYAAKAQMLANEKASYAYTSTVKATELTLENQALDLAVATGNAGGTNIASNITKDRINVQEANLIESQALEAYALSKLNSRNDYNHTIGLLNAAAGVASTMPPHANGNASGMAGTVNGAYRLSCYLCVPCGGMLRRLEQYFNMWGYRVDRLEIPDFKTRKYWNYIRCSMFNAEGPNIPGAYFDIIKTIFERGITFWHDPTHFMDYSLDNHQNYVN